MERQIQTHSVTGTRNSVEGEVPTDTPLLEKKSSEEILDRFKRFGWNIKRSDSFILKGKQTQLFIL